MTALERIRQEQEELVTQHGSLDDTGFWTLHRRWLKLQRMVLAICRGERCEEHALEGCHICRPAGPLRDDIGTPQPLIPSASSKQFDPHNGALWI